MGKCMASAWPVHASGDLAAQVEGVVKEAELRWHGE